MATNYKYTLKRNNGTDNDTLYPLTIWDQVLNKPSNIVAGSTVGGAYAPATGSLLYYSSSSDWRTLSAGTNGHVLTLSGGLPVWAAASGGGGGLTNTGTGTNALGIGTSSTATSTESLALGFSADAITSTGASAIGANSSSSGLYATAVGYFSQATGESSIAIGGDVNQANAAQATAADAIAIGSGTDASAIEAVAIGLSADATASGAIQLGSGTNSSTNTLQFRAWQIIDSSGRIVGDRMIDNVEWIYVASTTSAGSTATIDSTIVPSGFDWENFDYKFIAEAATTAEDNDTATIVLGSANTEAGRHHYVYNRVQTTGADAAAAQSSAQYGNTATSIVCGTGMNAVASGTGTTMMRLDFTVSVAEFSSGTYDMVTVEGIGSVNYIGTTANYSTTFSGTAVSHFSGGIDGITAPNTEIPNVVINSFLAAGATDHIYVKVYRRKKR
jgi:hypothetical protein